MFLQKSLGTFHHYTTFSDWPSTKGSVIGASSSHVLQTTPALKTPLFDLVDRGRPLSHVRSCACNVTMLGTSQRRSHAKRLEHCDLGLWGCGEAHVIGNEVGECAFLFPLGATLDKSCGKHFSQTHCVPSLELANPQLLHKLFVPWTPPSSLASSPLPVGHQGAGAPLPAFPC